MVATAPVTHGTHSVRHPRLVATVAGRPTEVLSFDAQHGQPIGTATVTLPLPLPDHLRGEDGRVLNQPIDVQAGYEEGDIRTVFSGRIISDRMEVNDRDRTATISARGWAALLDWPEEHDLVFQGPIALHDIVRSLCQWRRVPAYRIDPVLGPSGAVIFLGYNWAVNENRVVIPRRTSPLAWIDRKVQLFGSRIFDTPSGEVRCQRMTGLPNVEVAGTFGEGIDAFRVERSRELAPMVTYWTVEGPTYTDADGVQVPIISRPAEVDADPLLTPPGYRADRIHDNDLATDGLATAVRAIHEINFSTPYHEMRWEAAGDPWRQPGEAVHLVAPTFDVDREFWITAITQRFDPRDGYVANYRAWAGSGSRLPGGTDAEYVPLPGIHHVGDEYLSHYAVPSPSGTTITLPFTVPDEYTSIAVSGLAHGVNSYLLDGANADSTVSKVEVWQNGESVGSAEMPVMPENLLQRLDYTNLAHWKSFRMPVPGRLTPGRAELRIVAGEDTRAGGGPVDDFEVRDLQIEFRGVGRPILPRVGVA